MIELEIISISEYNNSSNSFVLILIEKGGKRALPIVVGSSEAYSIASIYQNSTVIRPLTHDLLKNCITSLGGVLIRIEIRELTEGVFYSSLFIEREGEVIEIDSRTSDAVSIALRFRCPIFTTEAIMKEAGNKYEEAREIPLIEKEKKTIDKPKHRADLSENASSELLKMLEQALNNENYELAARIRDELDKRGES